MTDKRLTNARPIVSVSGGKDSTAMCLHLMEMGYTRDDYDRVFMDTGWEHRTTYHYLDDLEDTVGPIKRIRADIKVRPEHRDLVSHFEARLGIHPSPMIRYIILHSMFPSGAAKWCTRELKIKPITDYFACLDYEYINVVGIRAEESPRRAAMTEWEWNDSWDCWVWRPLIDWTEKDVIAIHQRWNLVPNRLYLNGHDRVGCYPCVYVKKSVVRNLDDDRVDLIRELESRVTEMARLKRPDISNRNFFPRLDGIDEVVQWSRTAYGGKQFEMFAKEEPTCVKWGMCEFKGGDDD
jgi:3'-phosphoadenosine 5'-phosphosulfate sulfotransferase (PAPS reductase)/FAD synthetase|tara:strand:+ start:9425 stop:10306 length:882 start_codon:yes stop_codon:yes gene_type:complete